MLQQQAVTDLHPANATETAKFAEVLRGSLRYPSEGGGWQVGDIDFGEYVAKYCNHEVVIVIASIGRAGEAQKESS